MNILTTELLLCRTLIPDHHQCVSSSIGLRFALCIVSPLYRLKALICLHLLDHRYLHHWHAKSSDSSLIVSSTFGGCCLFPSPPALTFKPFPNEIIPPSHLNNLFSASEVFVLYVKTPRPLARRYCEARAHLLRLQQ